MSLRGRPPKPAEQKRREGNPGKRPIGDPVLVGARLIEVDGIPPVPHTLALVDELDNDGDAATTLWRETCALLLESNILSEGDLFAVEQFVMATLEARRAFFELRTGGSTVDTANPAGGRATKTTNPEFRVWRQANQIMLAWADRLGLSPVARSRLGLAIAQGRKLTQEIENGLPPNPVERSSPDGDDDEDLVDGEVVEELEEPADDG